MCGFPSASSGSVIIALAMVWGPGCVISLSVGDGHGGGSGGVVGTASADGATSSMTTTGEISAADAADAIDSSATGADATAGDGPLQLSLGFSQVKQFDFTWTAVGGADHYQLLESITPGAPWLQVGEDLVGESLSISMPLHLRSAASYVLRACAGACDGDGETASDPVEVMASLAKAVGYFKASNTGASDWFGHGMALSADGNTLVVGSPGEDSGAIGIGGSEADAAADSGAVYVFEKLGGAWSQQAYVKASNTDPDDFFGFSVALSGDGNTLVVGANGEDSGATGIDGDQADGSMTGSGAVYVFERLEGAWSQQAYIKASNTGEGDFFGFSVALSGDGNTLAVGANGEDSGATGIDGDQGDGTPAGSGATYVFVRADVDQWSQQAYVKAANPGEGDWFGYSVALSGGGNTLAVGAYNENSSATGIDGDQTDDSAEGAGAVYVFVRDATDQWSQQAYVKASNTDRGDAFGASVALSGNGSILAVGAHQEDGNATGIDGDQADDSEAGSGAVYVFARGAGDQWSQDAYVKASNAHRSDSFGFSVALRADAGALAVGSPLENGSTTGIGGDQNDDNAPRAGAVYVFERGAGEWSQQAYVKASNTESNDQFGFGVALSGGGNTLAVSAIGEDGSAMGVASNQASNAAPNSGAVYLY